MLHSDIEALIVWHQKIDGDYLDKLPKIKGIVRYGVGYDTIDLEEIRKRDEEQQSGPAATKDELLNRFRR